MRSAGLMSPGGAAGTLAGALLAALVCRRALLLVASLLSPRALADGPVEPTVALVVPARDEERLIGGLLASVERLDYPLDRLEVVLVDDGSRDRTRAVMDDWAEGRERASVVALERVGGRGAALNAGTATTEAEVIVGCDADLRLAPEYLRELVRPFADERVGGAAALVMPANSDASLVARYAALEAWVQQLVTVAGKDRLGLDPPTVAGAAYRRQGLDQIGGFDTRSSGEDVLAGAELVRAGWRTRFVPGAVASTYVVHAPRDFWSQRLRWARNVYAAGRVAPSGLSAARAEIAASALGYADRVALVAALWLAPRRHWVRRLGAAYAGVRAAEAAVAVTRAAGPAAVPRFALAAAVVLPLDAVTSLASLCALRRRARPGWRSPGR